ncbi:MAG: glycosyltransferase family 39 protein [Chthoniobacterales bacterium]
MNAVLTSPLAQFFRRHRAVTVVIVAWALAVLPNLGLRSFIWEEGTNAELARDTLERGEPFAPSLYGQRWTLSPPLISWMIAGTARVTGEVNEWSARLPSMLSVLATALLVFFFTRRFTSGRAAVFAAGGFLFCPLLLRKLTVAEPDTIVTAFLFAAFVLWWQGGTKRLWWGRALGCGLLLAIAALAKGPQPIAYFALGIGGLLFAHKRWSKLVELVAILALPGATLVLLAYALYQPGDEGEWLGYMRLTPHMTATKYLIERFRFGSILILDLIPMILLAFSFWRQFQSEEEEPRRAVQKALLWYAGVATVALFFWPGANTRYAMPAAPAVAILSSFAFDYLWLRRKRLAQLAATVLLTLFFYQSALVWVAVPFFAARFGANRAWGHSLAQVIGQDPSPVLNVGDRNANQLFYLGRPVRRIPLSEAVTLQPPAWLVLGNNEVEWLKLKNPGYKFGPIFKHPSRPNPVAVRIERSE